MKKLNVLYIASEADPLVKVGGLGDVAGALPKAIRSLPLELTDNREVDIRLCIPYYSCINSNDLRIFRLFDFTVTKNEGKEDGIIFVPLPATFQST